MKSLFAAAFLAAFVTSAPAVCFFPDLEEVAEGGAAEAAPDAPAESAPPADSSTENAEPETDQPAEQTLDKTNDKKPPMDVMRHRPGACPEGPPCKEGD
jgi:hypothetical protein